MTPQNYTQLCDSELQFCEFAYKLSSKENFVVFDATKIIRNSVIRICVFSSLRINSVLKETLSFFTLRLCTQFCDSSLCFYEFAYKFSSKKNIGLKRGCLLSGDTLTKRYSSLQGIFSKSVSAASFGKSCVGGFWIHSCNFSFAFLL